MACRQPGGSPISASLTTDPCPAASSSACPWCWRSSARLPEVTAIEHDGHHIVVIGTGELATAVIVAMHTAGVGTQDVRTDASTLEDAFVRLTGRHLHEAEEGAQS
jgi:hypothetical protein